MLISEAAIAARVDDLARQISADYAGMGELLLVGVLRGAFMFVADLSRRLSVPCRVDFIALAHYERGAVPTGAGPLGSFSCQGRSRRPHPTGIITTSP